MPTVSGAQFNSQSMSGIVGAATVGSANMNAPVLQQPGSVLPSKSSMSQSNWNLANNAIGAMRNSGRNDSFIQSHLSTEMAMQSRNWGLTDTQGAKAGAMINSGRSGQQVASALSTPQFQPTKPMTAPSMASSKPPTASSGISFNTFMKNGLQSNGQPVDFSKAF